MGLFTALGRRSSAPQEWAQLWEILAPLDGRTSPDAVDRWSRWAREQPVETLDAAAGQLIEAYEELDTENHGRALAVDPFSGVDRPFARLRFLRVLDRVILAGPEAVEQVAGSPELVRGHDTVLPLDPERSLDQPSPTTVNLPALLDEARVLRGTTVRSIADLTGAAELEAWQAMTHLRSSGAADTWTTSRRWPTVRSAKSARRLRFLVEDPEVAWLDIDTSALCDVDADGDPHCAHGSCWVEASRTATVEVYRALGGAAGAQHELAHRQVCVEAVPAQDATADATAAPDVDEDLPMVLVELALTEDELAVTDSQARAALLVRRSAERLSRAALPWGAPSREALVALASGAAV